MISFFGFLLVLASKAARFILEIFYNAYFYLYVLLGPIVIARTVFSEQLEGFFELVQEFLVLMFWPTMFVVMSGMSQYALGKAHGTQGTFGPLVEELAAQAAFVVMTLFVPAITKKFALHIGSSIISPLLRFTGIALGLTGAQGLASIAGRSLAGAGFHGFHFAHSAEKYISLGEIVHEHGHAQHAHHMAHKIHHALHGAQHELEHAMEHGDHDDHHDDHGGHDDHGAHGHGHEEHGDHGGHSDHGHHEAHADHGHHASHGEHDEAHHEGHQDGHHGAHADHGLHGQDILGSSHLSSAPIKGETELDHVAKDFQRHSKWAWFSRDKNHSSPQESDESRYERALVRERERAHSFLGPSNSEKNLDMEKCGIEHHDIKSEDLQVVRNYRKKVESFHNKNGWLYDFQGRFSGLEDKRPVRADEGDDVV